MKMGCLENHVTNKRKGKYLVNVSQGGQPCANDQNLLVRLLAAQQSELDELRKNLRGFN